MTAEGPNSQEASVPPKEISAKPDAGSHDNPPAITADPLRDVTGYGLVLVACITLFSALRWWSYSDSVGRYDLMSAIQGMRQSSGLPSWHFWEMGPDWQAHFYPLTFQAVGYFLSFAGVSPEAFITFVSWVLYPALFFTTWLWLYKVFGPRPALAAVILLCGSTAVFWNQTTYNAIAFAMMLAPLALLALESERFLACGVLNLLASTAHPMALFLPPALVINTLLRRKKVMAGLLAACLPVLFYGPWLAQLWTSRSWPRWRGEDQDILFLGPVIGSSLSLGVVSTLAACLGIFWLVVRRREALGLLGPLLGFAVVFPIGLGGHFLLYNFHWLLACFGGYGAATLVEWLERARSHGLPAIRMGWTVLVFFVLATWVAVEIPLPKMFRGETGSPSSSNDRVTFGSANTRELGLPPKLVPEYVLSPLRLRLGLSALAQMLDPNGWIAPVGVDVKQPEGEIRRQENEAARLKRIEAIQQKGVHELMDAIKTHVAPDEVLYLSDAPMARLVTRYTGRSTAGADLPNARSPNVQPRPEDCHFLVIIRGTLGKGPKLTRSFTRVFGNSFGTIYRNNLSPPKKAPVKPVVSALSLAVLMMLGIGLVVLDLWLPRDWIRSRLLAAGLAFILASACLAKGAWISAANLHSARRTPGDWPIR